MVTNRPTNPAVDEDVVRSFDRGLQALAALSRAATPMSLSAVGREIGTSRATARRLLLTLRDLGYVTEVEERFRLRPTVMELGGVYLSALRLPDVAHDHLAQLASSVGDTCSLTVLDGTDVVYVDRVKASRIMTVDIGIGTRMPAYATSTGRVLMSGLVADELDRFLGHLHPERLTARTTTDIARIRQEVEKARRLGYAIADKELDVALRSVAAPIHDTAGEVVAAINVSSHVTRTPLERVLDQIVPLLLATAAAISRDWSEAGAVVGTALEA